MSKMLIDNGFLIPMDGRNRVLREKGIVIDGNRIIAIDNSEKLKREYDIDTVIDARNKAVLPGFVNAHTHVAPTPILRGLTEDKTDGFYGFALPMEKHLLKEDVYPLSLLGCIDVIKSGSTCINEIWHYMSETARAIEKTGLRAVISHKIKEVDLSKIQYDIYEFNSEEGEYRLKENIKLIKKWHGRANGKILCRFGPHATDTVSPELFKRIRNLANKYKVGIHIHIAQSEREISQMKKVYGKTSVEFLNGIGFLGSDVIAAHLTYVSNKEIDILYRTGTSMAHCPLIMAKVGSFPPMREIYKKHIKVALGTDWVGMDPFSTMRFAIGITRILTSSIPIISSYKALEMFTIESARALGLEREIGSIEIGKKADVILIDIKKPHLVPTTKSYDIISSLVYNANGNDVDTVIIDGRIIMEDRKIISMNEDEIIDKGEQIAEEIWDRVSLSQVKDKHQ